MKKKLAVILAGILLLIVSGCGNSNAGTAEPGQASLPVSGTAVSEPSASEETTAEPSGESSAAETTALETTVPPETTAAETTAAPMVFQDVDETVYVTGQVNFRAEPSLDAEIKAVLSKRASVKRTGIGDEWSRVVQNGEEGYVSNKYLTTEKPKVPAGSVEGQAGTGIYHEGGDILVVIDAGHQGKQMTEKEPNGPGSSTMKAKVASGTEGVSTGNEEYKVTLNVALYLRDELLSRGYSVLMTRETNDVKLSNVDRAQIANEAGADAMVRIHCNSSEKSSVTGALGICQSPDNPYCGDIYKTCLKLTKAVLNGHCEATGRKNTGVWETDTMTGTNWCQVPNTIIEMGYMSNSDEDELMGTEDFQRNAAIGIADGLDDYFGR
ncbi:N-acetylmuramoyl-L-alanine amidase [Hominifimenecus sp. rT4P-3]|uniref:N-acetylmuramoyl-L-alanine amidase n=1 Tax=Hominifimenecus sp. rT4P-3 TaxID=3242979 RepID=UPI003DA438DC